jgi:MFS family permease
MRPRGRYSSLIIGDRALTGVAWALAAPSPYHSNISGGLILGAAHRAMVVIGDPLGGLLTDAFGYRTMIMAAAVGLLFSAAGLAVSPVRTVRIGSD